MWTGVAGDKFRVADDSAEDLTPPQIEGEKERAMDILPHIHLAFSNLKTRLLGTHHGSVQKQHMQGIPKRVHVPVQSSADAHGGVPDGAGLDRRAEGANLRWLIRNRQGR